MFCNEVNMGHYEFAEKSWTWIRVLAKIGPGRSKRTQRKQIYVLKSQMETYPGA